METYFKPTVTAKLPDSTLAKLNKNYIKIVGHNRPMSFKEYLDSLLDFALASIPEDGLSLPEALNVIKDLNQQLADKQHEMILAQQEAAEAKKTPRNVVKISFATHETDILKDLCAYESKRTGQEITPELLLKSLFAHQLTYGPGDWLPKNYSRKQLIKFRSQAEFDETDLNTPQNINELGE